MNKFAQLYIDNAKREIAPINLARNGTEASLYIYDVIDSWYGVSAKAVTEAIVEAGDAEVLHVYINSPGGSVFEGRAIMAALSRFKGKTVAHIDSLCASAATSIALACNEVEMQQGAFFMIHNASAMVWGDKNDMRETADLLEKIEGSIIADYVGKTGKDEQQVIDWMNAETWFNADEALEHGFIDRIAGTNTKADNKWNLAAFEKAPKALLEPKPEALEAPETEKAPPSMTNSNTNKLALIQVL